MENGILSDREIQILRLVAHGKSNKEIATDLYISINTVKVHLGNIFQKINVTSRTEATLYAIQHGIVESPSSSGTAAEVSAPLPTEAVPVNPTRWQVFWKKYWLGIIFISLAVITGLSALMARSPLFASAAPTPNPLLTDLNKQRWQALAPIPHARSGMAAAALENTIFTFAGETEAGPSAWVEAYDLKTNTWARLMDKPTAVKNVSAVLIGEKFYVPGGELPDGNQSDRMEVYNPRDNSWESMAPLPRALSAYALATYEGQLYLFGGWDGQKALVEVWRYRPSDDSWHPSAAMPTARAFAGATEVKGKIYVMGGWDGVKALDVNESFSPARAAENEPAWESEAPLPEKSSDIDVVDLADTIFVVGKKSSQNENFNQWAYSPEANSWQIAETNLSSDPFITEGACVALNDKIFLISGKVGQIFTTQVASFQAIYTFLLPFTVNN